MTVGEDNQDAYTAAEIWRAALQTLTYSEECEEGMSCDDLTDCLEGDAAVQAAVQAIVSATPVDGRSFPPGVPLSPSQMSQRLNEIDACGFDAFWAQVEQYVDYMVDLGTDVFERIEAYSNALEAGEAVPMGQFLGKLKNSTTAGKVIEFLDWALETVKEAYESADTAENRLAIKCAIFCAHRDDCLITIQGTLDILNERLGGLLSPGDLEDLPAMMEAFLTASFSPTLALDLWILFLMGTAKTAGMFGLNAIDETLQLVLAVAVNDANNDWELLCEDCAEPPVGTCEDFTADDYGWYPSDGAGNLNSNFGTYFSGSGLGPTMIGATPSFYWTREAVSGQSANSVTFTFNEPSTNFYFGRTGSGLLGYTGTPVTEITFSNDTHPGWFPFPLSLRTSIAFSDATTLDSGTRVTEFCFEPA